ncbi:hypothetical protein EYF80_041341 [Liparis tanakae]|uniref:Uncharacterized protein n=1 Tax=Liparis tanakae TaxID=230148 RepID=A0A4Z2G4H3_9TELE|nr:hypothetical protein EYF80_041341 [Liparis tanakae]
MKNEREKKSGKPGRGAAKPKSVKRRAARVGSGETLPEEEEGGGGRRREEGGGGHSGAAMDYTSSFGRAIQSNSANIP